MLELTDQAEEAIRGILASDGVSDDASFRITAQQGADGAGGSDGGTALAVSIVDDAPPEDKVVEGEDVEVRLDSPRPRCSTTNSSTRPSPTARSSSASAPRAAE